MGQVGCTGELESRHKAETLELTVGTWSKLNGDTSFKFQISL